jgi:DNA polymerase-3 subunit epsilon
MKKLFYDLETTGLDKKECGIHQISGCIEINGEIKEYFDFKLRPINGCKIEDGALHLLNQRGITLDTILEYPDPAKTFTEFKKLLGKYVSKYNPSDKFHLCGYNNRSFDDDFLRNFFIKMQDKYFGSFFWQNTIDVMSTASDFLAEVRHMLPNFKLTTVASFLMLEVDSSRLHDAEYDIELTHLIYTIARSGIRLSEYLVKMDNLRHEYDSCLNDHGYIDCEMVPTQIPVKDRVLQVLKKTESEFLESIELVDKEQEEEEENGPKLSFLK